MAQGSDKSLRPKAQSLGSSSAPAGKVGHAREPIKPEGRINAHGSCESIEEAAYQMWTDCLEGSPQVGLLSAILGGHALKLDQQGPLKQVRGRRRDRDPRQDHRALEGKQTVLVISVKPALGKAPACDRLAEKVRLGRADPGQVVKER